MDNAAINALLASHFPDAHIEISGDVMSHAQIPAMQ